MSSGVEVREMADSDVCCGFGGTFCVKYSDISNAIVTKKVGNIDTSGADMLLAGDLGCLMNMAGKLKRQGSDVEVRHVAEVLAGMTISRRLPAAANRRKRRQLMELTANKFKANASKALIDVQLQKALGNVQKGFIGKRAEGCRRPAGIR
jgi:hypothetical protein